MTELQIQAWLDQEDAHTTAVIRRHGWYIQPVPNPGEIAFAANRYYGRPDVYSVPMLQLSYDDTAGRFPWEADYAAPDMQPRPGTFRA